ncbi:oligopeptide ABC transporter permease OppB [bacterium AH-315-P15]|nr:oligopeptide ABC transporter permease OppB [bacterium AH-315-P15]
MIWFALRRLMSAIPTLFVVVFISFYLMHLAPGGPFDGERQLPPEIEANILAKYDLDKPLHEQFLLYIGGIVTRWDFGPSYKREDFTVTELIGQSWHVSARLGVTSLSIALVLGVTLGTLAALNQNSGLDYSVMALAMTGITVPNFVVAPILSLLLGVYLNLLPTAGWNNGALPNMILPVTALALPQIAVISRLTRGGMIEVLRSNFVRTARAKGLPEGLVIRRHAMRAGLLPVVSYLGPAIAGLMTGSLVIEKIFGLPGLGRYFVEGALQRDYTLVMGVVILFSALIITLNFLADVMYGVMDPRVRSAR